MVTNEDRHSRLGFNIKVNNRGLKTKYRLNTYEERTYIIHTG